MKGDFTRFTFRPHKHYSSVRMQQGRVQLDSDWNEQVDIAAQRVETETGDVLGRYGVPMENPGFAIKIRPDFVSRDSVPLIGKGHLYLDGILVENEKDVLITQQNDFLPGYIPPKEEGDYIAYLDVWERHVTALEDDLIREVALGGPDMATRTQTVWQVRLLGPIKEPIVPVRPHPLTCSSKPSEWGEIVDFVPGKLQAHIVSGTMPATLCEVPAGAGYRRLENQLYRVEIHTPGILGKATFKWSRDNGSIVTSWTDQDGNDLIVNSLGRDQVLGFAPGQTVELTSDDRELRGEPGVLVKLSKAEGQVLTLDPSAAVDRSTFGRNPKVRRWDSDDDILTSGNWIPLEDGVEVLFEASCNNKPCNYKTGDYWMIPARTAKNNIEWPADETNPNLPKAVTRQGIEHHYCRLAILHYDNINKFTFIDDCRPKFPPLTKLTSLYYVGGDGQEATPKSSIPNELIPLDQPLKVGVANGSLPLSGIKVTFEVIAGSGRLSGNGQQGGIIDVRTGSEGIAECRWELDSETQSQQVRASLPKVEANETHLPVIFSANLSRATNVYYKPGACSLLANAKTVQEAIDELCLMGRSPGCCVTVSPSEPLRQVIEGLKDKTAVRLCLLAGSHVINEDLIVRNKVWFEIFGCGADVQINCEKISIMAESINLSHMNFHIGNSRGQILLTGKNITGKQCVFIRSVGDKATPPLVYVEPLEGQKFGAELYWRDNWMESFWEVIDSKRLGTFLIPHESVKISPDLRAKLGLLAGITKVKNKSPYAENAKLVAHEISTLGADLRKSWAESIAKNVINDLAPDSQNAVKIFIAEIRKSRISEAPVLAALDAVVVSFRRRLFNQSLALAKGVGGWIEDNRIQGYLALHYDEKFRNLAWGTTNEDQQKNKNSFESTYGDQLISIDPESLAIRGNRFLAIHSNGQTVIDLMSSILSGKIPHFIPPPGYQHLHVGDNVFQENNSSFVACSSILSGNEFNGAVKTDDVGAFVWGKSGILLGNIAPIDDARIEKILKRINPQTNLTNLLQIV